jgi:apolipoprotein N-acyltransferase
LVDFFALQAVLKQSKNQSFIWCRIKLHQILYSRNEKFDIMNKMYINKILLIITSFVFIAWGQPALIPIFGLVASCAAYALFFIALDGFSTKQRFIFGTLFFTFVQFVQLYWLLSHPFLYIYAIYGLLSLILGCQFGLISILATRERLTSLRKLFVIPALWVLLEWSRLFFFSGFSFNPIGLSLATNILGLQSASLFGVFGMSFFVIFTNCLFARAFFLKKIPVYAFAIAIFLLPIGFGAFTLSYHEKKQGENDTEIKALIVHSSEFPEELGMSTLRLDPISQAYVNWAEIFEALTPFANQKFDLIVFPEIVVNLPAEAPIFPLRKVEILFQSLQPKEPLESIIQPTGFTKEGSPLVSSYTIAQGLSKIFKCSVICGLEGVDYLPQEKRNVYFNSAYFFHPEQPVKRYDKSILLPMAESIPFEWVKPFAASYGLFDSFGKGQGVAIFQAGPHYFGPSICYEDTFGNFIRQNSVANATCLVNLTNDGWYPNSLLKLQHAEHARLRAVENGVPSIRACNFGLSGAIDSLGKTSELVSLDEGISAFAVEVSSYTHPTLYAKFGDAPVIILALLICVFALIRRQLTTR